MARTALVARFPARVWPVAVASTASGHARACGRRFPAVHPLCIRWLSRAASGQGMTRRVNSTQTVGTTPAALGVAVGVVVVRGGPEVLLVHRVEHDDWSFPAADFDPGDHPLAAAVRGVAENTGLRVRLGRPLRERTYVAGEGKQRTTRVRYWVGRLVEGDRGGAVVDSGAGGKVDAAGWFGLAEAMDQLSSPQGREILEELAGAGRRTTPLIVLGHASARPRKGWGGSDRERPLTLAGQAQGQQLVPLLGAYGVERVVSSSSTRCRDTVAPYADTCTSDLELMDVLSEEHASQAGVTGVVRDLLARPEPAVLCSHRRALPLVLEALGLPNRPFECAEMLVLHHRSGRILASESHRP